MNTIVTHDLEEYFKYIEENVKASHEERKTQLEKYFDNEEFRIELDWLKREALDKPYSVRKEWYEDNLVEIANLKNPEPFELSETDWEILRYILPVSLQDF